MMSLRVFKRQFSEQRLCFLGLGNMGLPMAQNLVKKWGDNSGSSKSKSVSLRIFDANPARLELATAALRETAAREGLINVIPVSSVSHAAEGAELVVSMLFNDQTSESAFLEAKGGVFSVAAEKALVIDSTTVSPETAFEIGSSGAERGFVCVDAPVSGGVTGAAAGTLAFMCGTSAESEEKFRTTIANPVLAKMGARERIFYCGKSGTGAVAKICNNLALAIQMLSVAEGLNLGRKLGMDPKLLANVMNQSSARCWSGDTYSPCPGVVEGVPSSKNYAGGFKTELMVKDLRLAEEVAENCGEKIEMGRLALRLNEKMINEGMKKGIDYAGKDFGSIYEWLGKQ